MTNYDQYWRRLEFEHELVNRRLTWLLTSQTILFAAFAFTFDIKGETFEPTQQLFIDNVPRIGIAISILILIGIIAGFSAKIFIWLKYNDGKLKENREPLGVNTWITFLAFIPDILLPIAFAYTWWIIMKGETN